MSSNKTLLVIGSGPGIGRAVTTLFASKGGYNNIALIARRTESLATEQAAVEEAVGPQVTVKTYAIDVTDSEALLRAVADADAALGKPNCVFFNAARVVPSAFFEHDVKEIEYDLKVSSHFSKSHSTEWEKALLRKGPVTKVRTRLPRSPYQPSTSSRSGISRISYP
jgi:NAD(P)-dependent dehydrogenase (short-subunit alcohol dehydrogenase family)